MIVIGLDIGYSHTKVVSGGNSIIFPSLTGTADLSRFSAATNHASRVISYNGMDYLYGEEAVDLSRMTSRREDRGWIESDEYTILVQAALSHVIHPEIVETKPVSLVTGLPLAFYEDKDRLRSRLLNLRWLTWKQGSKRHHHQINFDPDSLRIVPQPFGSLFSLAFDPLGGIAERALLESQVGIIDVGGKTTNILVASRSREVARASTSVPVGGWEVVRAVRNHLSHVCSDSNLRDHEVASAIARGSFSYYGSDVALDPVVAEVSQEFCQSIVAEATQYWGAGAELNTILISGGGANLIGTQLASHFHRHADVRVVPDPQTANAVGYYRYGLFVQELQANTD